MVGKGAQDERGSLQQLLKWTEESVLDRDSDLVSANHASMARDGPKKGSQSASERCIYGAASICTYDGWSLASNALDTTPPLSLEDRLETRLSTVVG